MVKTLWKEYNILYWLWYYDEFMEAIISPFDSLIENDKLWADKITPTGYVLCSY